ncbi:MAG TPA: ester cyclase [Nitrososphaera sp.]
MPPSGKKISIDAMDFLTIIDGKITEEWVTADMMGLMQQIGAIPGESQATGTDTSRS